MSKCIFWEKFKNKGGYGRHRAEGKLWLAHRWAFYKNSGIHPKGKMVLHKCDNPACINPEHLYLGDTNQNMMDRKNRRGVYMNGNVKKTHCKRGHLFDYENTYVKPRTGARGCRKCRRKKEQA